MDGSLESSHMPAVVVEPSVELHQAVIVVVVAFAGNPRVVVASVVPVHSVGVSVLVEPCCSPYPTAVRQAAHECVR